MALISVHIPKTGGTSFRELLADYFGDGLALFYRRLTTVRMEPLDGIPPWTRAIHGHFGARDYDERFRGIQRIAWLREPVQRVVSEYEHHRRRPDPYNRLSGFVTAGATLEEFARQPTARDTQSRMLHGLPLSAFAFIGISEHSDLELPRLKRATGIKLPGGRRSNVNPAKNGALYELPREIHDLIRDLNQKDLALYEQACELAGCGLSATVRAM